MTNDDFEPYITPFQPSGGSGVSTWLVTPSIGMGGSVNFRGSASVVGSTEWGNRSDYVGKLGPAIGVYSSEQSSLIQDWV